MRTAEFVTRVDDVEKQELNEKANHFNNSQEATVIIYRYEDITKKQNKKALWNS